MSAFWPKWLGSSTSNPTGTYVAGSVGTGWDASINSNVLRQTYINGFLDVSATSIFRYDVSVNGNLFIAPGKRSYFGGDVSLGNRLFVVQDVSLNSNLFVNSDTSLNARLFVNSDASLNSKLFVNSDTSLNARLFVNSDASLNSKLFVNSDTSLNARLFVNSDASLNSKLFVNSDTSLNARLFVNSDTSLNGRLFVRQDTSLNSNLFVNGDISLNSRLFVGQDASINGNLFVNGISYLDGDISMNGNLVVFGNLRVQQVQNANIINTTVNNYQLIITEDMSLNGKLLLQKDASFGGNLIINSAGKSGTGNVGIGIASPLYNLTLSNPSTDTFPRIAIQDVTNAAYACGIGFQGAQNMNFFSGQAANNASQLTASAIRMTINGQTGYTGIGTTSPSGTLHIYESTGNTGTAISGSLTISHGNSGGSSSVIFPSKNNLGDYGYIIYQDDITQGGTGEQGRLIIGTENDAGPSGSFYDCLILQKNGGYVGVGTMTPAYPLQVVGQIGATSFNATSDYRIKDDVKLLDESFTIDNIRPVTFTNKLLKRQDIGMLAHEVQDHYPYLVTGEKDGKENQTVNYTGFIGLLIHEVKQLKEQINQMKTEIENLKANR
jgi:hypothetical protein